MSNGIYDFLVRDMSGRSELVFNEGVFLMQYSVGSFTHHLYEMGGYFAEVISKNGTSEAITIKAMRKGESLDAFLSHLELTLPAGMKAL